MKLSYLDPQGRYEVMIYSVGYGGTRGGLIVDAALEPSGTPIHELDGALGLDCAHGRIHILWDNVSAVHHATCHVLAMAGIALGHHTGRLEHAVAELRHRQLLVVRLLCGDHRCV